MATLVLFPADSSITVMWDVPNNGAVMAGGYLMCLDRMNNDYKTVDLSTCEAADKCYTLTQLINGRKYTIQYVQLLSDGTQISTPAMLGIPYSRPNAVHLVDAEVSEGELGTFNVVVTIDPISGPSKITFKVIQVHEDYPSIENDDLNAAGGIDYRNDILTYTESVDGVEYVLTCVPKGHYKICALYSYHSMISTVSNLLDVYVSLTPNNFSTLQVESGHDGCLPFSFTATDNSNARIDSIVATLLQNEVVLATIELVKSGTGNTWTLVGNNITGEGVFSTVNGAPLTNKTAYTVSLVGKTAPHPNSIGNDTDVMYTSPITSTGVPAKNTLATVKFNRASDGTLTGVTTTPASTDSFSTKYYSMDDTLSASNVLTILESKLFNGYIATVQVISVVDPDLVQYWTFPPLVDLTNNNPSFKGWVHQASTSAPLVLPNRLTCLAASGNSGKVPFTVNGDDDGIIHRVRVTLYTLGDVAVGAPLDLFLGTGANTWTRSNGAINGLGEFSGLSNDTPYRIKVCTFTENSDQGLFTSTTAVPSYRSVPTVTFTPSNGLATTGYSITSNDLFTHTYNVVFKDITGTIIKDVSTDNTTSTIDAEYLLDGFTITVTDSTFVDSEYWLHPPLYTTPRGNVWIRTPVVSDRLNIEIKPDKVTELQLVTHNTAAFILAFNANTRPDKYNVYLNGEYYESVNVAPTESSPSIQARQFPLTVGETYTVEIDAANNTGTSEKESITFTYVTHPPEVTNIRFGQDEFSLNATLQADVTTDGDWTTRTAVADITITSESGSVRSLSNVSVDTRYSITGLAYGDLVDVRFKQKAMYSLFRTVDPLLFTHGFEYSPGVSKSFTMNRITAKFTDLTWTQNDKLDNGVLSWTPPLLTPSASITYAYTITNNEVTSEPVSANSSGVEIPSVQYNVLQRITLTATVLYNAESYTYSDWVEFTPSMPVLTPSFTFTKVTPWTGVAGTKEVAYAITVDNDYTFSSFLGRMDYDDETHQFALFSSTGTFSMNAPGIKSLWFKVYATLPNGDFPAATNITEWIYNPFTWAERPSISLVSAERIPGGSSISYQIDNNGSYTNSVLGVVIPSSTEFNSTSISFIKTQFEWTDILESATFTQEFEYDIFPNTVANKDEISVILFASNMVGFVKFEQNVCDIVVDDPPPSVLELGLVYNTLTFKSIYGSTNKPDTYYYYLVRTIDDQIVDSATNSISESGDILSITIKGVVPNIQYKAYVRTQNTAGNSLFETVTFTYLLRPNPVVVSFNEEFGVTFTPTWTLGNKPASFYYYTVKTSNNELVDENTILVTDAMVSGAVQRIATNYTLSDQFTTYVRAQNGSGNSDYNHDTYTYLFTPRPVTMLTFQTDSVYFNISTEFSPVETCYFYFVRTSDQVTVSDTVPLSSIPTLDGTRYIRITDYVTSAQEYTFYIRTQSFMRESSYEYVTFTYATAPPKVTAIVSTYETFSFTSAWEAGSKPEYYYYTFSRVDSTVQASGYIYPESYESGNVFTQSVASRLNGVVTPVDLDAGVDYTLTVTAHNSKGSSQESYSFTIQPLPPSGVTAITISNAYTMVNFTSTWTVPTKPEDFDVIIKRTSDEETAFSDNVLVTQSGQQISLPISGLVAGTSYTVLVVANNSAGSSSQSIALTLPSLAPNPVTALVITNEIVSFNSLWDITTTPTSYYIYVTRNSDSTSIAYGNISPGTSGVTQSIPLADMTLTTPLRNIVAGTAYTVRVRAQNSVGSSDVSSQFTIAPQKPNTPTAVSMNNVNGALTFAYTVVFNIATRPTHTFDQINGLTSFPENATSGDTLLHSIKTQTLTNGTPYTFEFKVQNTMFSSDYITYNFTYSSPYDIPSVVTQLTVGEDYNTFSFVPTWTSRSKPTFFHFDFRMNGNYLIGNDSYDVPTLSGDTVVTPLVIGNLILGAGYEIAVRPHNDYYGETAKITFYVQPTKLQVLGGILTFKSFWTSTSQPTSYDTKIEENGVNVYAELITASQSGETISVNLTSIEELVADTVYTYSVRMINSDRNSPYVSTTFTYTPPQVTLLESDGVFITFNPTWIGEKPDKYYHYINQTSDGVQFTSMELNLASTVESGDTITFNLTEVSSLVEGTQYTYYVRVQTNSGEVSKLNEVTFTYTPPQVTELQSDGSLITFKPTWTSVKPSQYNYRIEQTSDEVLMASGYLDLASTVQSGDTITFNLTDISNLVAGTQYTYSVRTYNNSVVSKYQVVTLTYGSVPAAVTGVAVTGDTLSFVSTWTAATKPSSFYWDVPGTSVNGTILTDANTSGSTFTASLTGLVIGTSYTVNVQAINSIGYSTVSSTGFTYGAIPDKVTITVVENTLSFVSTWTAATKPSSFYWYVDGTVNGTILTNANTSGSTFTASLTGLVIGTSYMVSVQAINSIAASIETLQFIYGLAPDAVTEITVVNNTLSFVSSWTAATKPSSFYWYVEGTSYNGTVQTSTKASGSKFTASLTGLVIGTSYNIYVMAQNSINNTNSPPHNFIYGSIPAAATAMDVVFYDATAGYSNKTSIMYASSVWSIWNKPSSISWALYDSNNILRYTAPTITSIQFSGALYSHTVTTNLINRAIYKMVVTTTNAQGSQSANFYTTPWGVVNTG
jgi:hypothetical protein